MVKDANRTSDRDAPRNPAPHRHKAEARQGDLLLEAEPANDRFYARLIPRRAERPEYVFVSLAICGEGAVCN
jgi:hypothetical protein